MTSLGDLFYLCMNFSWMENIYTEINKIIAIITIIFSKKITLKTDYLDNKEYTAYCLCRPNKIKIESGQYYLLWIFPTSITWEEEICIECGNYEGRFSVFSVNHRYSHDWGIYASSIKPRSHLSLNH